MRLPIRGPGHKPSDTVPCPLARPPGRYREGGGRGRVVPGLPRWIARSPAGPLGRHRELNPGSRSLQVSGSTSTLRPGFNFPPGRTRASQGFFPRPSAQASSFGVPLPRGPRRNSGGCPGGLFPKEPDRKDPALVDHENVPKPIGARLDIAKKEVPDCGAPPRPKQAGGSRPGGSQGGLATLPGG